MTTDSDTIDAQQVQIGESNRHSQVDALDWEILGGGQAWLNRAVEALGREIEPLLSRVRRESLGELPSEAVDVIGGDDQGASRATPPLFRPLEVSFNWLARIDDWLDFDVDSFLSQVYELATSFSSQLVSGMLSHISEICEANGQVTDGSGLDIFDAVIDTMEKVEMSFDENGKPNLDVVINAGMAERLRGRGPTPEQEARAAAVINRRREEWNASRRLTELP